LKIAVNLLPFREKIAGAGKYAQKILQYLSEIDKSNQYILFVSEAGRNNFSGLSDNFNFQIAKFNPEKVIERILWEQLVFPFKLIKLKPDIIFTPSVAVPFFAKGRFFTTIHDLAYKIIKSKYSPLRRLYIRLVTTLAAKKSNIIFTVSNFSKREIEKEFKLKNKKVLVTYNGVGENFYNEYSESVKIEFNRKYKLPDDYLLYVGAIEPGKNLDKLFLSLAKIIKDEKQDKYLVLTSGIGWKQQQLFNLVTELGIENRIIRLPYINDEDMPLLYNCASMLIYLSSYEGFGIPVLEAMAAGTPVITSKSEAITEFAGDSVLSVSPENINEIVHAILLLSKDENFRKDYIRKGKNTANRFHWANSAKIIYDEINYFSDQTGT